MTTIKLGKFIGLSLLGLSLAACSSMRGKGAGGEGGPEVVEAGSQSQSAAVSQGVDGYADFDGSDRDGGMRLVAPHNQIYHFDFDNSQIKQEDQSSIMAQARYLASHPSAYILLTGNTDERGSREYNIALGERRANRVRAYLKQFGVRPNQVRTVSYGQERPMALGHNEDSYQQNRRVELIYEAQG